MAHIPDGLLSAHVLIGGAALTAAGLVWSLRYLDERTIPRTAVLSAMFFAGSLLAVPIGPTSVHLLFSGLMGLLLGALTIPAVFIALILQAVMFGFGGLTTLGVNTVNIAVPGVLFGALFASFVRDAMPVRAGVLAGICAALSVATTGAAVATALLLSSSDYVPSAKILLITYLPLMLGEALITGVAITFLKQAKPETFARTKEA
jgi:cobalt/nickel transport system permease protein